MNIHIPLYRPDLAIIDEQILLAQLARAPFQDAGLLTRWENLWERLWNRYAVAFARHDEAVMQLKRLLGWSSGATVLTDPLLDPVWREALHAAWLHTALRDVEPRSGCASGPPEASHPCTLMLHHPFGLPATPIPAPVILEEISSVLQPLPGVGHGLIQLVNLEGPRILPVGSGCVLLSTDAALMTALARQRLRPPGAAACALGCALLENLPQRLQRRRELAERYLSLLRLDTMATPPHNPASGRSWESFFLTLKDPEVRTGLESFLVKANIGCGSPLWFPPPEELPGVRRFLRHTLALPLYAALSDGECKRIINRLHRWVERAWLPPK
ncbi:MAG: DegT/DnrJ/EryC1/StrS aminotransferase family protein [Magnetococcales bacterium]|nr:DegT/DnrJ/EryC1/StrS aminotransferase family protein [Magnetococcales bacterium]